ncbi:MAG: VWA domain-containing protein [Lachnospiraceae bacterium]|nr:VWA domain-containing protein [Lachnospiraceae bacterium]
MKTSKLKMLLIIILCFILVFTGCSKAESKKDSSSPVKESSVPGTAKDDDSSSSGERSGSSAVEPIMSPDSPVSSSSASDSGSSEYKVGADALLSESKFSLSDASAGTDGVTADAFSSKTDSDYGETEPMEPIDIYEPIRPDNEQISAGLLTAGEWNDNKNFDFLKKLLSDGQNYPYENFFTSWNLSPFNRLVIECSSGEVKVTGAKVSVLDQNGNPIWQGVTDYEGTVYAYYALLDPDMMPAQVKVNYDSSEQTYTVSKDDLLETSVIKINLEEYIPKTKTLDLMFTVDTTGSMGDEIFYLQKELENVIKRVQEDSSNIPTRLSVNFYRDHGDSYVVRPYEFSSDINSQLAYLNKEYATGGGDFEEALEEALESSIKEHAWNEDSIKLLFLVLDAPPHKTDAIKQSLIDTLQKASEMGIRIIPVASSGIDKDTEFLLRAFAMTTGGTYTFLTDDSGIGGSHLEPTVGEYTVEHLNDLLVRIIEEYIG